VPDELTLTNGVAFLSNEAELAAIAAGVHDAGNPYFDFLFGGPDVARATLDQWIRRPTSEVYAGRAQILVEAGKPVGGFIAMSGADCVRGRLADAMALISDTRLPQQAMSDRLARTKGLFVTPASTDWYVSKVWVHPDFRGRGYGHRLAVEAFLRAGQGAGRTVADVHVNNVAALHTYAKHGITEIDRRSSPAGLTYVTVAVRRPG